jgi:hypothetical protein
MMPADELTAGLRQFYGSEDFYNHWTGALIFTEGVKHLADMAEAHWLIDLIASHQRGAVAAAPYQVWILKVCRMPADRSVLGAPPMAVAACYADYDAHLSEPENYQKYGLARQEIPFTDFPLDETKLYVEGEPPRRTLLLPREH